MAAELAKSAVPNLRRVVNGTGVVIHTNLGRSPLPESVRQALNDIAFGYSNLEFDLERGERGSRYSHVERLLCELTGAEAALVVNNNAAATYLILAALCAGREVIVSRGQLIEIGGSFRLPSCMRQSGAIAVEVGTTNRTHLRDYERALADQRDSCAAWAPAAAWLAMLSAAASGNGLSARTACAIRSRTEMPSMYSMAMKNESPSCPSSWIWTMLGCWSRPAIRIS